MNIRQVLRPVLLLTLLCFYGTLSTAESQAQVSIDFSQLEGTFEKTIITGDITLPGVAEAVDARLVIEGTQILGTRLSCLPPYSFSTGAEMHIFISIHLDENFDYLLVKGSATPPTVGGDFVVELPLTTAAGLPSGLFPSGGTFGFEFYIAHHPDWGPVLCNDMAVWPITTIQSASIVTSGGVATENSNWGSVKALYR